MPRKTQNPSTPAKKTVGRAKVASKAAPAPRRPRPRPTRTKPRGFIISPFDELWDAYNDQVFEPAIKSAGLDPVRADIKKAPTQIVTDIWHFVQSSDVLLADLTGRNPNVFYELGLAHAVGKPVVLISQDINSVPFDVHAIRVIQYTTVRPDWAALLGQKITASLREVIANPEEGVFEPFLRQEPSTAPTASPTEKQLLAITQELRDLQSRVAAAETRTFTQSVFSVPRTLTGFAGAPGAMNVAGLVGSYPTSLPLVQGGRIGEYVYTAGLTPPLAALRI